MERAIWLKQMREKAERLYDTISPQYWVRFGLTPDEVHIEYLNKFLAMLPPKSMLLSAGCGAGKWDGMLRDAGQQILGIDQSEGMLRRARERLPGVRYEKLGLQEMDFHAEFDGVLCVDVLEHVPPEDWPGILVRFHAALKPGGLLYFTVDISESADGLQAAFERAWAQGLPVVHGEVVDRLEAALEEVLVKPERAWQVSDAAVYHFHPQLDQVRAWLEQAGFALLEEGAGDAYEHFLVRKVQTSEVSETSDV